jgi:arsenate reductase (thioredoxin)
VRLKWPEWAAHDGTAHDPRKATTSDRGSAASLAGRCRARDKLLREMTAERVYNVLFLCTGNSARSILAESLLNALGKGKFRAFSAGSFPKGQVHPLALDLLKRANLPTENLGSKSWDEFAAPGAPQLDFIVTVCDNAAGEACPLWPGKPMTAHWGIADPAAAEGTDEEKMAAFRQAFQALETRIKLLTRHSIDSLDRISLYARLREIGQTTTGLT